MSFNKMKNEIAQFSEKFTKENQQTNLNSTIVYGVCDIAEKYGYYIEDFNSESIGYGEKQRNKVEILNNENKVAGVLSLNVYRNEHGTYEYNIYLTKEMKKTFKP